MIDPVIIEESRAILAERARSFRWGAVLLPQATRDDSAVCYAFCRLVDDAVDEAPSEQAARQGLDDIDDELAGRCEARPLIAAYGDVAERRRIHPHAARELLQGCRDDLGDVRVASDEELLRYCYRVAGTVGLMMCGILDVTDEEALPHAIDLGIGMQLTNICRDVAEDAGRDRVYLPADRLAAAGVTQEAMLAGDFDREAVYAVVRELLHLAERYYESAHAGMGFIPARARSAILVAADLYRSIGRRILVRGPEAVSDRTVVSPLAKTGVAASALLSSWTAGRPKAEHPADLHMALRGLPGISAGA